MAQHVVAGVHKALSDKISHFGDIQSTTGREVVRTLMLGR